MKLIIQESQEKVLFDKAYNMLLCKLVLSKLNVEVGTLFNQEGWIPEIQKYSVDSCDST